MARELAKYPTPSNPGDDAGVGPSWRDVMQGLDALKTKTGHEYTFTTHSGHPPGVHATTYLVVYLRTGFPRPWAGENDTHGHYLRFPNKLVKTMPATLIILIEREYDAYEAYRTKLAQSSFLQDS